MNVTTDLSKLRGGRTGRCSSWDRTGRNGDAWIIEPGETRVLANIHGPGAVTHIWMTQPRGYRECLLRMTWHNARRPSILVPLGDFFCLGHGIVNSFQSLLFTASTEKNNEFNEGCALNCYARMPFQEAKTAPSPPQSCFSPSSGKDLPSTFFTSFLYRSTFCGTSAVAS